MEIDNIYNMDCLEGMKQIPDGTIDAVICDLPYGTVFESTRGAAEWDRKIRCWYCGTGMCEDVTCTALD